MWIYIASLKEMLYKCNVPYYCVCEEKNEGLYIDIQERLMGSRYLPPVSNIYLLCLISTVLVPYLLKSRSSNSFVMNGIGTLLYLFVCKGKILHISAPSFAFIAPVAGVLLSTESLGYEATRGPFVVFGLSFVILIFSFVILVLVGSMELFPPAAMGLSALLSSLELALSSDRVCLALLIKI